MSLITLHHLLFALSQVGNPHLLLEESLQVIWQGSRLRSNLSLYINKTDTKSKYLTPPVYQNTKLLSSEVILVYSVAAFLMLLASFWRLNQTINKWKYLMNSLTASIVCQFAYLYIINLLENVQANHYTIHSSLSPITNLVVLLVLYIISTWLQSCINVVWTCITLERCSVGASSKVALQEVSFRLVNYMMWAALGTAIYSTLLCEIFILEENYNRLRFTNVSLGFSLAAMGLELLFLRLFWRTENESIRSSRDKLRNISCLKFSKHNLNLNKIHNMSMKPVEILSSSASSIRKSGAVIRTVDDEEFTSSPSNCEESQPNQSSKDEWNSADRMDYNRSLFSLYDNFKMHIEPEADLNSKFMGLISLTSSRFSSKASPHIGNKMNLSHPNLLSIINTDLACHALLLILIGSIYRANQLFFLVDYLYYLIHNCPPQFQPVISSYFSPFTRNHFELQNEPKTCWLSLICICLIFQSCSKIITLHIADYVKSRVDNKLVIAIISSLTIVYLFQISLCLHLTQPTSEYMSSTVQVALVLVLLALSQFQIGIMSALADFVLNHLSIHHSKKLAKSGGLNRLPKSANVHYSIQALLEGTYYHLGTALCVVEVLAVQSVFGLST